MNVGFRKFRLASLANLVLLISACTTLTGCLVAGVSSGGGFFIWPGSLGLLVVLLIIFLIMRRR